MLRSIGRTVLLVRDYDEALAFYRDVLGFGVLFDATAGSGQRFLHLGLPHQPGVGLWLLEPSTEADAGLVGRQSGGQPLLVVYTDDCRGAVASLRDKGVRVTIQPREERDAIFAHIVDLYGNELVVVQLKQPDAG